MNNLTNWLEEVRSVRLQKVFNPYNAICELYDTDEAPVARFSVLSEIMKCANKNEVDSIWIGRDLGYRGGRRTGLALTDDVHFDEHLSRWNVKRPKPFLKGEAVAERTASVIWNQLQELSGRVLLWNVFPFHPHEEGDSMTNRAHTSSERAIGEELLAELIRIVQPKSLVAVGQNASDAALRCAQGASVYTVRHPSYGGQRDFVEGIRAVYSSGLQHRSAGSVPCKA